MNRFKSQFQGLTSEVLLEKRALGEELDSEAHKAIEEIFAERGEFLPPIPSSPILVSVVKKRKVNKFEVAIKISLMLAAIIVAQAIEKTWVGVVIAVLYGAYLLYKWSRYQLLSEDEKTSYKNRKKIQDNALNELMIASAEGKIDRVKELINFGADVNALSSDGSTALMYAARNNHIDVVKALVAAGANVHVKNEKGSTAASIADHFRCQEVSGYFSSSSFK